MDITWPLVGRRAEVEVLSAVLADTPAGGVVLAGEAGVGKTRLAREALARAAGGPPGGRFYPVRGRPPPAAPGRAPRRRSPRHPPPGRRAARRAVWWAAAAGGRRRRSPARRCLRRAGATPRVAGS